MAAHAAGMLAPGALVVPSHVHVQAQVGLHVTPVSALCLCLLWCSISSSWSIGPQWYCNMPVVLQHASGAHLVTTTGCPSS